MAEEESKGLEPEAPEAAEEIIADAAVNLEPEMPEPADEPEAAEAPGEGKKAKKAKKGGKKKWPIVVGVVVVVLVIAVAGGLVWHEQPSFCNAICHTPMDGYLETYEQEVGTTGVDKWGNEVSDTSSVLACVHREEGDTCLTCHEPTLSEQITEGLHWVSGNYTVTDTGAETNNLRLNERNLSQLTEASGKDYKEFCLTEGCHEVTLDELAEETSYMGTRNVHSQSHTSYECSECHKAHRASVNVCSQCHNDATIPDGWLSWSEYQALQYKAVADEDAE